MYVTNPCELDCSSSNRLYCTSHGGNVTEQPVTTGPASPHAEERIFDTCSRDSNTFTGHSMAHRSGKVRSAQKDGVLEPNIALNICMTIV